MQVIRINKLEHTVRIDLATNFYKEDRITIIYNLYNNNSLTNSIYFKNRNNLKKSHIVN